MVQAATGSLLDQVQYIRIIEGEDSSQPQKRPQFPIDQRLAVVVPFGFIECCSSASAWGMKLIAF